MKKLLLAGSVAFVGTVAQVHAETITFIGSQNWVNKGDRVENKLMDAFTKETGIQVDVQVVPDDQYANVLKTKIATGETPDIFMVGAGAGIAKFFPDKNFADLSKEAWVSRYRPYAKEGTTYNGRIVGFMTWNVDGWSVLYNPDIYQSAGIRAIPKTYDEFLQTCKSLAARNITPIYEPGKEAWHWGVWFSQIGPMAASETSGLYERLNSNKMKFAEVKTFETFLTQLKGSYDAGCYGKSSLANTWDSAYEVLGKGRAAAYLAYTTYQDEVLAKYPESKANGWKMYPIPFAGNTYFSHSAGGNMRVAYKNSPRLAAVKKYFDFVARPDNLKKFYAARTDLQSNPSFNDVPPNPTEGGRTIVSNSGGGSGLDLEYGVTFWDNTAVGNYIVEMLLGSKTPKQVLQAIDRDRGKMFSVNSNQ